MRLLDADVLDCLGVAVGYPSEGYLARIAAAEPRLEQTSPQAATALAEFRKAVESMEGWELQELYTRTFDLSPVCTLEVGWHLYGEQYRRGRFLVKTRELLTKVEIAEQ